jgi:hypothetical protein
VCRCLTFTPRYSNVTIQPAVSCTVLLFLVYCVLVLALHALYLRPSTAVSTDDPEDSSRPAERRLFIFRFLRKGFWRLYPGLLLTFAFTMLSASTLQLPENFSNSARSALSVLSFSSNILFLRLDNYFDAAAPEKPLLHTRSLGLEEQFYVGWSVF